MDHYIEVSIRAMTGMGNEKFSPQIEAFFRRVNERYKNCGSHRIPQDHLPIWMDRYEQTGGPIKAEPKVEKVQAKSKPVGV